MPDFSLQLADAQRLHQQGKPDQARAAVLRILQRAPSDPAANQVMALLLALSGKHDQAIYYIDRAVAAAPEAPPLLMLKATILSNTPRVLEAIPILRRVTDLAPRDIQAWCALGALQLGARQLADAHATLRHALTIAPNHPDAASSLAALLLDTGHPEQAIDLLRSAAAQHPANLKLAETLAFCINYDHRASALDVFHAHKAFGTLLEQLADRTPAVAPPRGPAPAPSPRLRIGYLSPDLRHHAVATFIEPILRHHDRAAFEVFIYHTSPVVDDTTRRLRPLAEHWRGSTILSDADLESQIRGDRLDILIELSGLSAQHRLMVMARRPAPIQATFIGYPNTTGLTRIDYQVVDAITDPPGAEALATERLARLPHCLLCYTPPTECPAPAPRDPAAPITFASFNTVGKTTDFTLSLWAKVLAAVPTARLLLKATGLSDPATHESFRARAAAAGIDPARLDLLGFTPRAEHMAAYHRADICLDPYPFNGATTTCDALWMGVPVITLAGDRHVSRASASILTALGKPDWIARTPDDYITLAARLAANPAALAPLRTTLREQMQSSPLCDAITYTRALETLYRSWRPTT